MNKKRPLYKDLIITLITCLVFTMTLGSFGAISTYAAVSEVVFTPQETAENILNGIDVPVSSKYQGLIEYNILSGGDVFKGSGECWGYAEKVRKLFGSAGTLYRHTDGTLAYFVDNEGNKYTEGLELERFWEGYLYYGDTEGHKFKAYKDGKVYFYDEVSGEYKKVEEGTNES